MSNLYKIVSLLVVFFFSWVAIVHPVMGQTPEASSKAKRIGRKAYMCWPEATGRKMIGDIKTCKDSLARCKTNCKEDIARCERKFSWCQYQRKEDEKKRKELFKSVGLLKKDIDDLTKKNKGLEKKNQDLNVLVATYKGQRYEYLLWGVGIGIVVTAAVATTVGILIYVKK